MKQSLWQGKDCLYVHMCFMGEEILNDRLSEDSLIASDLEIMAYQWKG